MLKRSNRHPSLLSAADTLMVVIDMQEPFLRNTWNRDRVIRNVELLLHAARVLRVSVVPTLQYAQRMGPPIPEVARHLPSESIPFDKLCFSCMGDDAFASEVQRSGHRQVLICGVETHVCVNQTALDLVAQGYQVHVAADSVSSRTQSNWEIGLNKMEQAGVVMSSAETAIYEMLYEAGTPEFSQIQSLIKAG